MISTGANLKKVLQVHHNIVITTKAGHSSGCRANVPVWHEVIDTKTVYSQAESFFLPNSTVDNADQLNGSNVVILNDFNSNDAEHYSITGRNSQKNGVSLMQMRNNRLSSEIIIIRHNQEGFELYLDFANTRWHIGKPGRANYKLANVLIRKLVRITINGKSDLTGSGRDMRTYIVRDYVFEYLGDFNRFLIMDSDRIATGKKVPLAEAHHIDLRKVLF